MAKAKTARDIQRQRGQFMTPLPLSTQIVSGLKLSPDIRILEPSFGEGAFLLPIIRSLMGLHCGTDEERFHRVLTRNVWGVEIDDALYQRALDRLASEFGPLPHSHNLQRGDFFRADLPEHFDHIAGNPPFGGTFDPEIEDQLDRELGVWGGHKIKKETYAFFIAASIDLLKPGGQLSFISSDTMLTIKTMGGLRRKLLDTCDIRVERLSSFSEETAQPTLVLYARRSENSTTSLEVDGHRIERGTIDLTPNFSWGIDGTTAKYFESGTTLADFIVGTSGMTIGNNNLFLRRITNGYITEHLDFEFFDDPVTLKKEIQRARLNRVSERRAVEIQAAEKAGLTRRNVRWKEKPQPLPIDLPHPDYAYYNKACSEIVFSQPKWAIYWRDNGDAVQTFKRNGKWYLSGVGGKPFFGRAGLTWQLVSPKINMRYLPEGYILDTGAPCAFLRDGVDADELWFILGWCLTDEATRILKTVINHTRNIQGKDIERLPYPSWVSSEHKAEAIKIVSHLVGSAQCGNQIIRSAPEIHRLNNLFAWQL